MPKATPDPHPVLGTVSASGPEADPLALFHPVTAAWFRAVFDAPTAPQRLGWPAIARGESSLILAPTGTGKTLTAFLWCLDRLMLQPDRGSKGCRIVYISPLKALAVDVERNLRSPLAGISNMARRMGVAVREPEIAIRTGDTSQRERARFRRTPADILITTPESLYLLLTTQASESLRGVETVIVDEIHSLVPTKRGAHLALSLERLEALACCASGRRLQRIGLSATQRPLEEVARFLGGVELSRLEPGRLETGATPGTEPSPFLDSLPLHGAQQTSSMEGSGMEGSWSADPLDATTLRYRPVAIVNAGAAKRLKLRIEVPVEDMARLGTLEEIPSGPASQQPRRVSIWNAIHPRLLEIIREHNSTILFVNSRQVAERLAGALNELAGEPIAGAHHGSLAAAQRGILEEQLKAGKLRALCATSTLELGIDMGAVDLVIQIEAPPSVAGGMQRIGRAGHTVGAVSEGVLFPKYRADLVACAAVTRAMHEGAIESTRYPRNPLDVLAQQLVAIVAHPPNWQIAKPVPKSDPEGAGNAEPPLPDVPVDDLYDLVRRAAPFAALTRSVFDGVLDLLAGRYPSDEFAELRPRLTWDRIRNTVSARHGAARLAILNAGTIPDRGLYGVFLAGGEGKAVRVGELDEEMVFESHAGETFILGASTWRIEEITHDRVLVVPAPGEPGKMPFWKGDGPGRPLEFGRRIGKLVRELAAMPKPVALARLVAEHDLDPGAAENLLQFLADQQAVTAQIPDDRTIVIERCRDELGDWRVCVLTPFGSRIHIPWAMAVTARIRAAGGPDVETIWGDDGFVLRFPDTEEPPTSDWFLIESAEAMTLVLRQLGSTALFAGRFREAAGRALLLPRKRADQRAPLWQLRKRAYDLLGIAARYPSFPILLEAYRECLRDVFDMPALIETLRAMEQRELRVHVVDTRTPSPFAASLLFSYVANFLYDGDAPLAERRAQALTIDQDQLHELLGDADLRELLDADAIVEVEEQLQCLAESFRARTADGIHDLLLRVGDLSREELARRVNAQWLSQQGSAAAAPIEQGASAQALPTQALNDTIDRLIRSRRLLDLRVAGERRLIAMEDCARYRDGLGIPLPPGIPAALLDPVAEPVLELARRFARTHGPFTLAELADRFALDHDTVERVLRQLVAGHRIVEGGFRPLSMGSGLHREWCDVEALRLIRRKSLARLRREVESVEPHILARFLTHWQGVLTPRRGLDALLDAIEGLQGAPLPASLLETAILPARIQGYSTTDLDTLIAAGEVAWVGAEPLGERDGRVALYLAEKLPLLVLPRPLSEPLSERESALVAMLRLSGASFFDALHQAVGGGYPGETLEALWSLVWRGMVSNDSLHALRAYVARPESAKSPRRPQRNGTAFRSRRTTPPTAHGRWSLVVNRNPEPAATTAAIRPTATESSHALALQMLARYGILLREHAAAENLPGGFSSIYDVLKALEESGRIRRGYFVSGLGATQFALPAAVDLLRSLRGAPYEQKREFAQLAAVDPANPYGSVLRWPQVPTEAEDSESAPRALTRSTYADVILCNGHLVAWLRRNNPNLLVFLPSDEPERGQVATGLAQFLAARGQEKLRRDSNSGSAATAQAGTLISTINGIAIAAHPMADPLMQAGFHPGPLGLHLRRAPVGNQPRPELPASAERGSANRNPFPRGL